MSAVSEDISKIRMYGFFPFGHFAIALSHISHDPITRKAIYQLQDVGKKKGILDLDAHRKELDIFASIVALAKEIPDLQFAAGLMTIKWVNSFFGGEIFKAINIKKEHLSIQKVVRFEDAKHASEEEYGQRKGTNLEVMNDYLNLIDRPHAIGNIAPYGSRKTFRQEERIRNTVIDMVRESPSVYSLAKPVFPSGFHVYLSPVFDPMGNIPEENIRRHIQNCFEELLKRAG